MSSSSVSRFRSSRALANEQFQNKNPPTDASVRKIQKSGIEVQGGFIVGFDNDPLTIFDTQIRFIQKSGVVTAMVGILTALPRTQLYERLKKEQRLVKETSGDNTDFSTNFVPRMDYDLLISGVTRRSSKPSIRPNIIIKGSGHFSEATSPREKEEGLPVSTELFRRVLQVNRLSRGLETTVPVLEAASLDCDQSSPPASSGRYPLDLRVSFSEDL